MGRRSTKGGTGTQHTSGLRGFLLLWFSSFSLLTWVHVGKVLDVGCCVCVLLGGWLLAGAHQQPPAAASRFLTASGYRHRLMVHMSWRCVRS
jgi:hypothetical protein